MRQITDAVLPNLVYKKGRRSKRACARALLFCRYLSNQDVWCVFRETHNLTRHGMMAEHHGFSGFSGVPIVLVLQLQLVAASLINMHAYSGDALRSLFWDGGYFKAKSQHERTHLAAF